MNQNHKPPAHLSRKKQQADLAERLKAEFGRPSKHARISIDYAYATADQHYATSLAATALSKHILIVVQALILVVILAVASYVPSATPFLILLVVAFVGAAVLNTNWSRIQYKHTLKSNLGFQLPEGIAPNDPTIDTSSKLTTPDLRRVEIFDQNILVSYSNRTSEEFFLKSIRSVRQSDEACLVVFSGKKKFSRRFVYIPRSATSEGRFRETCHFLRAAHASGK